MIWADGVPSSPALTLKLAVKPERWVARLRNCSPACDGSGVMISSVPVRMTSGSMWSAGHASTAARGTPPATPPGVPPRWSTPVRTCRLAREDGRMFCCCHIDVGPHAVDDNPVARSEAMPRRSLRQFTNISNMVFNEALRGVASSGEEVGTPGRTISLLRPKLASCPKNFALGLIKRRAALQAENIALPHQLSVLQRTNVALQWGANRANSECVDYLR